MKSRNPLSTILSLLILIGSVVVVGFMLGGVLGTDPESGDKPAVGLERGIESTSTATPGQDEPFESPGEEEAAREAVAPIESASTRTTLRRRLAPHSAPDAVTALLPCLIEDRGPAKRLKGS